MQVLPVIVPYIKTTSNLALSCKGVWVWLSNNGFAIRISFGCLSLENLTFYKSLGCQCTGDFLNKEVFRAIKEDQPKYLQSLLDKGANIETKYGCGETALIWSALHGKVECLQLLLESGANIEAKDIYGTTALFWATKWDNVECLKLLLDRGANTEARSIYGNTGLACAVVNGKVDCIKLLLQHGAKVKPCWRDEYPELWGDSTL